MAKGKGRCHRAAAMAERRRRHLLQFLKSCRHRHLEEEGMRALLKPGERGAEWRQSWGGARRRRSWGVGLMIWTIDSGGVGEGNWNWHENYHARSSFAHARQIRCMVAWGRRVVQRCGVRLLRLGEWDQAVASRDGEAVDRWRGGGFAKMSS